MENKFQAILSEVAKYYAEKLQSHGAAPQGVDWNGEDGQKLRFLQLLKLVSPEDVGTLCDLGCGYGAMRAALQTWAPRLTYHGVDISPEMITAAKETVGEDETTRFTVAAAPVLSDYVIASGIFNVKGERRIDEWYEYVKSTLDSMHKFSVRGFAFNCLTKYSDADKMKKNLFYPDPCEIFDRCKRLYSRNVALLHDYNLYEFTVIVRK